jgi:hypothetical protein
MFCFFGSKYQMKQLELQKETRIPSESFGGDFVPDTLLWREMIGENMDMIWVVVSKLSGKAD